MRTPNAVRAMSTVNLTLGGQRRRALSRSVLAVAFQVAILAYFAITGF